MGGYKSELSTDDCYIGLFFIFAYFLSFSVSPLLGGQLVVVKASILVVVIVCDLAALKKIKPS